VEDGTRVFIRALRRIRPGDELLLDYRLAVDGRRTAAVKRLYACRCGAQGCRGTMLA
jgi:SET domain-containing protein